MGHDIKHAAHHLQLLHLVQDLGGIRLLRRTLS